MDTWNTSIILENQRSSVPVTLKIKEKLLTLYKIMILLVPDYNPWPPFFYYIISLSLKIILYSSYLNIFPLLKPHHCTSKPWRTHLLKMPCTQNNLTFVIVANVILSLRSFHWRSLGSLVQKLRLCFIFYYQKGWFGPLFKLFL